MGLLVGPNRWFCGAARTSQAQNGWSDGALTACSGPVPSLSSLGLSSLGLSFCREYLARKVAELSGLVEEQARREAALQKEVDLIREREEERERSWKQQRWLKAVQVGLQFAPLGLKFAPSDQELAECLRNRLRGAATFLNPFILEVNLLDFPRPWLLPGECQAPLRDLSRWLR